MPFLLFLTGQPEKVVTNTQKKISTTVWLTVFFIRKWKIGRKRDGSHKDNDDGVLSLLPQICVVYPSQVFEPHASFYNSTSSWTWGFFCSKRVKGLFIDEVWLRRENFRNERHLNNGFDFHVNNYLLMDPSSVVSLLALPVPICSVYKFSSMFGPTQPIFVTSVW